MSETVRIAAVDVRRTTPADIEILKATMRQMDRDEMIGGEFDWSDCEQADCAYSVFADGDLLCVIGIGRLLDCDTHLSTHRQFFMLSTEAVNRHRIAFVRSTRQVALFVLNQLPSWVDRVISLPMKRYEASVRWQERMLGFRQVSVCVIEGREHVVMELRKGGA